MDEKDVDTMCLQEIRVTETGRSGYEANLKDGAEMSTNFTGERRTGMKKGNRREELR